MPLDVLLLGVQGSGKGTQAKRIASDYGLAAHRNGRHAPRRDRGGTALGQRGAGQSSTRASSSRTT